MKYRLKRNEIILISVLGVLLYVFLVYKFVWNSIVPQIEEQNTQTVKLEKERQKLNSDLSNIDLKRIDLESKKAGDERLEAYLNNEANITDCIEYIDKLAKVVGSDITNVNISAPQTKEVTAAKYYAIKMDFNTVLPLEKIKDMIGYVENSSRLIDISRFTLTSPKEENINTTAPSSAIKADKTFQAGFTLNMYTLNIEAADKIYEYSRHKFNRYDYEISALEGVLSDINSNIIETVDTKNVNDFEINLNSFLTAGDNFIVLGSDRSNDKITLKTNKYITMEMRITNNSYTFNVNDGGKAYNIKGTLPTRDLNMSINVDLSEIQENNKSGIKIKVINDSTSKLNVTLADKSKRVTLTDREGKIFYSSNDKEKVYIK